MDSRPINIAAEYRAKTGEQIIELRQEGNTLEAVTLDPSAITQLWTRLNEARDWFRSIDRTASAKRMWPAPAQADESIEELMEHAATVGLAALQRLILLELQQHSALDKDEVHEIVESMMNQAISLLLIDGLIKVVDGTYRLSTIEDIAKARLS